MFHVPAHQGPVRQDLTQGLAPLADALFALGLVAAAVVLVATMALLVATQPGPSAPPAPTPRFLRPGATVAEARPSGGVLTLVPRGGAPRLVQASAAR